MFGFGKPQDENSAIVQQMRESGRHLQDDENTMEGLRGGSAAPTVIITYLTIAGALFGAKIQGFAGGKLPWRLPHVDPRVNSLLFGAEPPSILHNATGDAALAAGAQALVVCVAAAVLPALTRFWRRLRDNAHGSMYVSFWGVSVIGPFVFFFLKDFLWPILRDIFSGF